MSTAKLNREVLVRIGEALGLHHEDIRTSGSNEIYIIPRNNNADSARAKSNSFRVVHVSKELMTLYSDYLIEEYPEEVNSDYVFVNIWEGQVGSPMTYSAVASLFNRLSKKTEINARPHLFRHTHYLLQSIYIQQQQQRIFFRPLCQDI